MATPTALLASNSDITTPQTCRAATSSDIGIGIDKLALSLPVAAIVQDPLVWDQVFRRWAKAQDYLNINTSLHVTVRQVGPGLRCTVEYNPARLIDPVGWSLCSTEQALTTVPRIMGQLRGRVDLVEDIDIHDILVTRLDVARDFAVADPQFFLTGLQPLHRSLGANPTLVFDHVSGAACSLIVSTARAGKPRQPNRVTLYDKGLKREDARGVLRCELEARTWLKRYGGIRTLDDLTPERVERLFLDRWAWSRMGEVVVSRNELVHGVYAADWLDDNERFKFLGQHFAILAGERVLQGKAREKYNRIQRGLGITASETRGTARRLDLVTGTDLPEASEVS